MGLRTRAAVVALAAAVSGWLLVDRGSEASVRAESIGPRAATSSESGTERQVPRSLDDAVFGRAVALGAFTSAPDVPWLQGSVTWMDSVHAPSQQLDGVLALELDDGRRLDAVVQDGRWQARVPAGARARLVRGQLAGSALEAWSTPVALFEGVALGVRACKDRTLVVRDGSGAELSGVSILGRPDASAQGDHPGPTDPSEVLALDRASPVHLEPGWLDGRALWAGVHGLAWRRIAIDDATAEVIELRLDPGADVNVTLRGQRPPSPLALAARDVESGRPLFECLQPEDGPPSLTGLPRRRIELALLRPELGWGRAVSSCILDLSDGRKADAILDWPIPFDRAEWARLEGQLEFEDGDLPPELLAVLRLEFHLLDGSGQRGPRVSRTVPFERWRRTHPSDSLWEFDSADLISGTYALVVHPLGHQVEVVLQPGVNHTLVRVGPLARTLLELVDATGAPIEPPLLRVVHSDPDGSRNESLPVHVARAPDGSGYVVHSLPGRLDVSPRQGDLWPRIRSFVVEAGWNHIAMECSKTYDLELHALRDATPTAMPDAWWNEIAIAAPASGGQVLGLGRTDLRPEGPMRIRLSLSEPGDWRLTFLAIDGQLQESVAHVDPEGSNQLFLELGPRTP